MPHRVSPIYLLVRSNVSGSQQVTPAVVVVSSGNSSPVCSDTPTLTLVECDHSIASAMATSDDTFDESPRLVPTASSSAIPAPTAPKTNNDILRSRLCKPIPLPSVCVGPSSVIDCDSMKEVVDSLFCRLEQQQEIVDRYGDMEAEISRQIACSRQLEKDLQ